MYIGNITSRDSNHLPHDFHYDVLPTTQRMACSNSRGKLIYEGYEDNRWRTGLVLVFFFIFVLTVRQIQMFFSLKPSLCQGESYPSKFQPAGVCRFRGFREQTNKQTDRQGRRTCLIYFHSLLL